MPRETFVGPVVPALMARAQAQLGRDAVILGVKRVPGDGVPQFELSAIRASESAAAEFGAALERASATRTGRPVRSRLLVSAAAPAGARPVIALVGPTGAGKTTTLAKLANHAGAYAGKRAGFLCLDTYRVGAAEQLGIYAELSGLPLEVVYAADELPGALRRLARCDVLLVDTAGRGPRGGADLDATDELIAAAGATEVHVALPAGLERRHARRIVNEQVERGATHLLPTKLDECAEDLTAWSLADQFGLGLRWAADGQEVPDALRCFDGVVTPVPAEAV